MKNTSFRIICLSLVIAAMPFVAEAHKHRKKHVCTESCHTSGKHVYAHGEKGHVCTDACKK